MRGIEKTEGPDQTFAKKHGLVRFKLEKLKRGDESRGASTFIRIARRGQN